MKSGKLKKKACTPVALKFFDKMGASIQHDTWQRLFARHSYRQVQMTIPTPSLVVETTWVGVGVPCEGDQPKLFLTEIYKVDEQGQRLGRESTDFWDHNLAAANSTHGKRVREIERAFRDGTLET